MLRIDESTLYRHLRNGTFPSVKIGGRYVVPAAVIEQLVNEVLTDGRCVRAGPDASQGPGPAGLDALSGGDS